MARRAKRKAAQQKLRQRKKDEGLVPRPKTTIPNTTSDFETVEEEREARENATVEHLQVFRSVLPQLLDRLGQISDFRDPNRNDHRLDVLMIWGILAFVYQMSSRREANRNMTRPMFLDNLRTLLPELELNDAPHMDTVNRVLSGIEPDQIEETLCALVRTFIKKKTFHRYLLTKKEYMVAIDGTQKLVRRELLSSEWLERYINKGEDGEPQYYVYVLEANLVFPNGISIPLLSEFLDYGAGDTSNAKQDCEQRAFGRLAARVKEQFPRLRIMLLLDGLYSNGPIIERCRKYNWDFMIVLQDKCLPTVWAECGKLRMLASQARNRHKRTWHDRRQRFEWFNGIEYSYGPNRRKRQTIHLVVCDEEWEEIDSKTNKPVTKTARHAWISSRRLHKQNVHSRCNLSARHRWAIEESFLIEKHHGYQYEHCFSYNWKAMRGFHALMRIAHMFNVLAQHSLAAVVLVREFGASGFFDFVRQTIASPWLDSDTIMERLKAPVRIRLV